MTSFFNPDQQFNDNTTGAPLALGVVYFGQPNQNPETNEKQPFSDRRLSVAVSAVQTLTAAGKFPTRLYLDGNYSMLVRDAAGNQIINEPFLTSSGAADTFDSMSEFLAAGSGADIVDLLSFHPGWAASAAGPKGRMRLHHDGTTGGTPTTITTSAIQTALATTGKVISADGKGWIMSHDGEVHVAQFGAAEDESSDESAAIRAAANFLETTDAQTSGGVVNFSKCKYYIGSTITTGAGTKLGRITFRGKGVGTRIILQSGANVDMFAPKYGFCLFENMFLDGNNSNNVSGSCINLDNTNSYCVLFQTHCRFAAEYGLTASGIGQFAAIASSFNNNGLASTYATTNGAGVRITNCVATFDDQCNFEDNYGCGLWFVGSSSKSMLSINGNYFENNVNGGSGTPAEGWHILLTGLQPHNKVSITDNYLNGQQSAANQWGIGIEQGSSIDGLRINGNHITLCTLGAFDITSTDSAVGLNDLRNNYYGDTTPIPSRKMGFLLDDSVRGTILCDALDLSGSGGTVNVLDTDGRPFLMSNLRETYSEASSADAGVTVRVGYTGSGSYFYTGTSAVSQSANAKINRTLAADRVTSDVYVNIYTAGGKVGTGEVRWSFDYILF